MTDDWTTSARHLVKYPECNATDHLFGGQLLAWLDEGSAIYAQCQMGTKNLVTAHFGEVNFGVPVPRGSVVSIKARTLEEGDTSLRVEVKAEKIEDGDFEDPIEVVRNELVFVAVDEDGKPTEW